MEPVKKKVKKAETKISFTGYLKWNHLEVKSVLTTDSGLGGADLRPEKVEFLCQEKFNGLSLGTIVQGIKENGRNFAFEQLNSTYNPNDIPQLWDTCKVISYWVKNTLMPNLRLQNLNNKVIKQARSNIKFEYLRNLHEPKKLEMLENLIGTNIELPVLGELGSNHLPKDFDLNSSYLLTRQRFEILKKVIERNEEGFVLSGPFGISKSYCMYLIACYAVVNSIPLLYVPKCSNWTSSYVNGGKVEAEKFLFDLLEYWNSDILDSDTLEYLKNCGHIVFCLSRKVGIDKPVFFLFDEHDELFKKFNEGKFTLSKEDYFYGFTKWTIATCGDKTTTVYCGSAHSSFEYNLPGGAGSKVIKIIPPTEEEFKVLIQDFGLDSLDHKKITFATGRIPKELKNFTIFLKDKNSVVTDDTVRLFIQNTIVEYNKRLEGVTEELILRDGFENELTWFHKSLEGLFTLGLSDQGIFGRPYSVPGIVNDKGLLYRTHEGLLYFINEAAKRVLLALFCQSKEKQNTCLSKHLIRQEFNLGKITHRFNLVHSESGEIISYSIDTHQNLDLKDLSSLNKDNYLTGTTVLFVPEYKNFPSISYLIIHYEENVVKLYLKQVIDSSIDAHYRAKTLTDLDKLLDRNYFIEHKNQATQLTKHALASDYTFSLLELFIHGVIGNFGDFTETIFQDINGKSHLAVVKRNLNLNFKSTNNELCSKVIVGNLEIYWYYIYESGVPSKEQSIQNVKENGVLYRNREDIEKDMKIMFEN